MDRHIPRSSAIKKLQALAKDDRASSELPHRYLVRPFLPGPLAVQSRSEPQLLIQLLNPHQHAGQSAAARGSHHQLGGHRQ